MLRRKRSAFNSWRNTALSIGSITFFIAWFETVNMVFYPIGCTVVVERFGNDFIGKWRANYKRYFAKIKPEKYPMKF